jgi:hypothetical protein
MIDIPLIRERFAAVEQDLAGWRVEHPTATLAEIEATVEAAVSRLQRSYLSDLVHASAATSPRGEVARADCRACGGAVEARGGAKERNVLTPRQTEPLRLRRQYVSCSACGSGLFPPG